MKERKILRVSATYKKSGKTIESIEFHFLKDKVQEEISKKAPPAKKPKKVEGGNELDQAKKDAMALLMEEGEKDASSKRVEKLMDTYGINDPLKAVQLLITKNRRLRE